LPPSALRVHAALITVSLLFGGSYVFTKRVLETVPPTAWVLFRIAAATALMLPLAALLARQRHFPPRKTLTTLLLAALLGVAANQVLFVEGMARTTPEHSALVNALIPTWTLLAAVIAGQERLTGLRVLSIAVSLCGVLYLGLDRLLAAGHDAATTTTMLWGDLLTMGNGIAFAVHLVLMKRLGREVDPWLATAFLFVTGTVMVAGWSGPHLTTASVDAVLHPPAVWFAAYVVVGATVVTYLLNTWALRHTRSSEVALYINVQPLVAAGLNTALGAPPPGAAFFVALGLVAAGLWLQTRARSN
jgi:drug/metabolite transporter (DMT)-like permease